jgi:hypothetical protein
VYFSQVFRGVGLDMDGFGCKIQKGPLVEPIK